MKPKFNPWPLGVTLFFIVFACGMATAVTIAVTHRDGLVEENYYDSEIKYQDEINSAHRAQQSGAGITQDLNANKITIQVPVALLAQSFSGRVEWYRPSSSGLDRSLALAPDASGKEVLDVASLTRGAWQLRVRWNAGGEEYFIEQKIFLPAK